MQAATMFLQKDNSGLPKGSQSSLAVNNSCKCKKSEKDVRGTQSVATSAVPNLQDKTTSTFGLGGLKLSQSSDIPNVLPCPITFHTLDEFYNRLLCETEESARLFTCQVNEINRRSFVLLEQRKKMNELNILRQSATAAVENCERNLLYISHAHSLMDHSLSSLLELYLRDTRTLPGDERGSFYKNLLSIYFLRAEMTSALEDLSADKNEVDDSNIKLQVLQILNYHYQVLCTAELKIDKIKQAIEEIQEGYKLFFEKCPYVLCCIPGRSC